MKNTGTFKALGELPDDLIENYKKKEYEICVKKCNKILKHNPNNGMAYFYLGTIAENDKNYEDAVRYFRKVAEIEPRFYIVWDHLGQNYIELKKYKEALDAYQEIIGLVPHNANFWCSYALAAQELGDNCLALEALKLGKTKVNDKGQSLMSFSIGVLEELAGNKDEALIHYVQSQIRAIDDESKKISDKSTGRIYKMFKED
jgi:tetratricopeptide (TPR) repeat protein